MPESITPKVTMTLGYLDTAAGPQAVCSFSNDASYYRITPSRWVTATGIPLLSELAAAAEVLHNLPTR